MKGMNTADPESPPAGQVPQTAGDIRVLIADDDEINRSILTHLLRDASDLSLTLAADGRQALELAMARRFDVLIFDLNMPFLTGDRLIRHIRASQSCNADSALILFTASHGDRFDGDERLHKLIDHLLSKPIRAEELLRTIRHFGRARKGAAG